MTTPVVAAATASVGVAPTLPAALVSRACSASGDTIAARERAVGLWCERTWRSVRDEAAELGMGLRALGVRAGDRVGIAARNSLTWVAFDLGVQGIGAVSVTLPPTTATDAVIDLARRHTLRVVLVDDDDQASTIAGVDDPLTDLLAVVTTASDRLGGDSNRGFDDTRIVTLARLRERSTSAGRGPGGASPVDEWERSVATIDADSTATISLDRDPSGAWVERAATHRALVEAGVQTVRSLQLTAADQVMSIRSLADPYERAIVEAGSLAVGYPINFPQTGPLLLRDLGAVQPSLVHVDTRLLTMLKADFDNRAANVTGIRIRSAATSFAAALLIAPGFVVKMLRGGDRLASLVATIGLFAGLALFGGLSGGSTTIRSKAQIVILMGGGAALTFALLGGPATWALRAGALGVVPGLAALLLGPLLQKHLDGEVPGIKRMILTRALRESPSSRIARRPDALRVLRVVMGASVALSLILNNVLRHSATAIVRMLLALLMIGLPLGWAQVSGLLVYPFVRRRYGFSRARMVVVADGPPSADVQAFWDRMGVPLVARKGEPDA